MVLVLELVRSFKQDHGLFSKVLDRVGGISVVHVKGVEETAFEGVVPRREFVVEEVFVLGLRDESLVVSFDQSIVAHSRVGGGIRFEEGGFGEDGWKFLGSSGEGGRNEFRGGEDFNKFVFDGRGRHFCMDVQGE